MGFKQAFSLAIGSLLSSKMRSLLTMLGIIIGVASVIILVSLVGAFSGTLSDTLESMGTNLITVSVTGKGSTATLSATQMMNFAAENDDVISYATPVVMVQATVKNESSNTKTTVYGVNECYEYIKDLPVEFGRFIGYSDVENRQRACVIGSYINKELYNGEGLGKLIKINGISYTVVGILPQKQSSAAGSTDDQAIVPYTTATSLSGNAKINSYSFSSATNDTASQAMQRIKEYMFGIFRDEDAYRVLNMAEILDAVNEMMGQLSMVLVGIAAISLLVGGIGIMNIMLVSVTERTREIGIRKALGGKRRDIMRQFIIEAGTTSAIGGVIGIIIGCAAAQLFCNLIGLKGGFSVNAIVIAFSVSVAIGVFFGYFPAAKASKLNPIDALKFD